MTGLKLHAATVDVAALTHSHALRARADYSSKVPMPLSHAGVPRRSSHRRMHPFHPPALKVRVLIRDTIGPRAVTLEHAVDIRRVRVWHTSPYPFPAVDAVSTPPIPSQA
ncbi:hypothetical protein B0H17DRAFT_1211962 [Mycena rosella]|uniref:Uncharacterized protein n=1 Tax=Mycena rosella TaxID=1033263 RepID=A0AAD7G3G3_MYCRO|nr:hypothetical protein B0H17DRAFT_1211962 [Mycena rosella]